MIRAWFEHEGFIEVETSCLQVSPGNETHLHAFKTELVGTDLSRQPLYLHTSPEFVCKKLLAAGEQKIFTFGPVFRNRERGALHHPEFTMIEWYRTGAPYEQIMDDSTALIVLAARAVSEAGKPSPTFQWRDRRCAPTAAPEHLTVFDAFSKYANIDLATTIKATEPDTKALAQLAQARGIRFENDDTWSDIFARILTSLVEPNLGLNQPTLLTQYPAIEAALAQKSSTDPRVAERFELYCCGVELANGFGELTDPQEQRTRFEAEMREKQRIYGETYPIDEDFLKALREMPPASGAAMGFDRLVMLATKAQRIEQVIWSPLPPTP